MEVLAARRRPSHVLTALLLFVLLVSFPYLLEAGVIRGEGPAPAASLVDATRRDICGRRLLQRSAPPPPAPVSGPPIGPALPYTPPPPL